MELLLMILLNVLGISETQFQQLEQTKKETLTQEASKYDGGGWEFTEKD